MVWLIISGFSIVFYYEGIVELLPWQLLLHCDNLQQHNRSIVSINQNFISMSSKSFKNYSQLWLDP